MSGSATALAGYAAAAGELAPRYDAIACEDWYRPVRGLIPGPCRMVDIGAGTGRDARWFSGMGFDVLAVEPTPGFREHGAAKGGGVAWLDDRLPELERLRARGERFGFVNVSAVWHHLSEGERAVATPAVAAVAAPRALLLMALRHGPARPDRPGFPVDAVVVAAAFAAEGFSEVARVAAASITPGNIAAGVSWTWLAMRRGE